MLVRKKRIRVLSSTLSVTSRPSGSIFAIVPIIPPIVTTRSFFFNALSSTSPRPPGAGAGLRGRKVHRQNPAAHHLLSAPGERRRGPGGRAAQGIEEKRP